MKKLKRLVLISALGAVVAAVARKMQSGQPGSGSTWQSADAGVGSAAGAGDGAGDGAGGGEQLVDNAPSPAGMPEMPELPDEPVMPDAVGPQALAIDDRPEAQHPEALSVDDDASPGDLGGQGDQPRP
ncbi:hypothetical protein [Nocardioides sp. SYSU DS0651]|uniref:hypothetical protein n=1 Tax=Nocardioides sp. SYSU DS0651 TaxID=3415955 RepID=UPI003F4B33D9